MGEVNAPRQPPPPLAALQPRRKSKLKRQLIIAATCLAVAIAAGLVVLFVAGRSGTNPPTGAGAIARPSPTASAVTGESKGWVSVATSAISSSQGGPGRPALIKLQGIRPQQDGFAVFQFLVVGLGDAVGPASPPEIVSVRGAPASAARRQAAEAAVMKDIGSSGLRILVEQPTSSRWTSGVVVRLIVRSGSVLYSGEFPADEFWRERPSAPRESPSAALDTTETPPAAIPKPKFVVARALLDVRALEALGVRSGGSAAELRGADLIAAHLREAGVADVKIRAFPLPPIDKTSRNVIAVIPGESRKTIILGAHMDSKYPSPGANDNGTGCGALLEISRSLAERPAYPTVKLVFFGTEEMVDANADHHHFGSRAYDAGMSQAAKQNTAAMISVDMIGYGPALVVRSMGKGPQTMVRLLLQQARQRNVRLSYLADPGPSGWSDHEAFELAQIPVAWIEWREDPSYHTTADTSPHLVPAKVREAGQFVLDVLYGLDQGAIADLAK